MSRSGGDFVPRVLKLSRLNFNGSVGLDNKDGVRFSALAGCVGLILFSCSHGLTSVGSVVCSIRAAQV